MCRTHSTDHVSIGKRLLLTSANIVSGDAETPLVWMQELVF